MNTKPGCVRRDQGSALVVVLGLTMAVAFLLVFLLQQGQVQAKNARIQLASVSALYDAYGELEKAQAIVAESAYNSDGKNQILQVALATEDRRLPGTNVVVDTMTGVGGTWYSLTVAVPYEGDYERVVTQPVREVDYFSSYNLFVSEDPAGISGAPIGAIHSNKRILFYFPDGSYQHSVTAVEGAEYTAGATTTNTSITGPFNPNAEAIELDLSSDNVNLGVISATAESQFKFDATVDVKLRFHTDGGDQWVEVETWSKPSLETITEDVIVDYDHVNPREETYNYTEEVSAGFETRTREVEVFDHYETQVENVEVPVYVEDVRMVNVPVYRDEERTREVPVYRDEERTRTVTQTVWVPLDGSTGGTTVAGDTTSTPGYWAEQDVEETYTVRVVDHYETQTYTQRVFDHYETQAETYQRLDHYETVEESSEVAIYRTETESYEEEIFETVERTATHTVYDEVPIYETQTRDVYHYPQLISRQDMLAPENGLIFAEGSVKEVSGQVVGRVTVASNSSIMVSSDLVYVDPDGDTAYLNGKKPWLPYEPNPAYTNRATLGLIAQQDVLYSRDVPDNFEINASMLAIAGRVGMDGVVLDDSGEVSDFNVFYDDFGRRVNETFRKNSIRRLGGITTARRPVETVLDESLIGAGFNIGKAVFDVGLLDGPPPYFLTYPTPRFFASQILK